MIKIITSTSFFADKYTIIGVEACTFCDSIYNTINIDNQIAAIALYSFFSF